MSVKIYWIHNFEDNGRIGTMARPRGNEWLNDETASLQKQNVQIVVSLLENWETLELGLNEEEKLCTEHSINFISFPIEDRNIPINDEKVKHIIKTLTNAVKEGASVVIHCRMGIGRSSIIAGAVMIELGFQPDKILEQIAKVRGLKVPDTKEQTKWLFDYNKKSKS